jgi:hypothetical protein
MDYGGGDVAILRQLQGEAEGDAIVCSAEEGEVDVVASVLDGLDSSSTLAAEAATADCSTEGSRFWD